MDWHGRAVTVMGLGRHGGAIGAVRFLAARGAQVTVTDTADETALRCSLDQLADVPSIKYELGGHREETFCDTDYVVVNPAVKPDNRWLRLAVEHGASISSEIELLLNEVDARVVAVTGSNGKSTTAAMIDAILRASGRRTWLGGNLGGSLLPQIARIGTEDWLVLELSSFQLHRLDSHIRHFDVSVVTSCTPNHLDWHPDLEHYIRAKQRIIELTAPRGSVVLNGEDTEVRSWTNLLQDRTLLTAVESFEVPALRVSGEHNRDNARLAAAAAFEVGCDKASVTQGLSVFKGLPHRLELVATIDGRRFINDSASTTPESTMAAMDACPGPLWLLAGGSDKGSDFHTLAQAIAGGVKGVAFYGAVGPALLRACEKLQPSCVRTNVRCLEDALGWCWQCAQSGDSIILSPGCASGDQFNHYVHRGEVFRKLVARLKSTTGQTTLA